VENFPTTHQLSPGSAHATLCALRLATRTLRAVWAATWDVHMLHYGLHPVAARPHRPHTLCIWAGRAGFGPWTVF
jgi:hypothetical protein